MCLVPALDECASLLQHFDPRLRRQRLPTAGEGATDHAGVFFFLLSRVFSNLHSHYRSINPSPFFSLPPHGLSPTQHEPNALTTTPQHFELLPEPTLHSAQSALLASLTPEVASLLARVESHLDKLARREQALMARCELLEGRIGERRASSTTTGGGARGSGGGAGAGANVGDASREALRLKQLRGQKERLGSVVERLVLQAQQRERQLRMSVAVQ